MRVNRDEILLHHRVRQALTELMLQVRDIYSLPNDNLLLVATDRQSAFDRILAAVPFKGQVLNLTSAWWFEKTKDIVPNAVVDVSDPNYTIAKKVEVFPVEFVVRGYITGSTDTSLWTHYKKGERSDFYVSALSTQRAPCNFRSPTDWHRGSKLLRY